MPTTADTVLFPGLYAGRMDPITLGVGGGGIIALIIFIVTVVSIANNPNHGVGGKIIWIIVAFVFSILGSILWLIFGRGRVAKS